MTTIVSEPSRQTWGRERLDSHLRDDVAPFSANLELTPRCRELLETLGDLLGPHDASPPPAGGF